MKTFKELMANCPKHDCAYVFYNKRWHKVSETELLYIEILVAKGELSRKDISIKYADGSVTYLHSNGRPDFIGDTNLYTLSSRLKRDLNKLNLGL